MTPNELSDLIKRLRKRQTKLAVTIEKTLELCKHEKVVTLCSYYGGSYSYDRDDWHPEMRKCLICGLIECGPSTDIDEFKLLKNPIKRFEYSVLDSKNKGWKDSPLNNTMKYSLEQLEKWVSESGYRVW